MSTHPWVLLELQGLKAVSEGRVVTSRGHQGPLEAGPVLFLSLEVTWVLHPEKGHQDMYL